MLLPLMTDLIANETSIRLAAFVAVLVVMGLWELASPHRRSEVPRLLRWSNNFALVIVDTVVLRLVFPIFAAGVAAIAVDYGWGLLNVWPVYGWLAVVLSVVVLDLTLYAQHIVFHKVPVLWRLHRTHHSDPHFDVSTALRFHPAEVVLSMFLKMGVVVLLGAPPEAVILFEVLLNGAAIFNHANIRVPRALDRAARWVIVTPDMHRIHHSQDRVETDSNYGFFLPWWDRVFGTYRRDPALGQADLKVGVGSFGSARDQWLHKLLGQPFR